jgi:hypothetical protein
MCSEYEDERFSPGPLEELEAEKAEAEKEDLKLKVPEEALAKACVLD